MPQRISIPESDDETPAKHKDKRIEVRIDPDLEKAAKKKAKKQGWTLSSVLRALLSLWTEENVIDPEDVGRHVSQATSRAKRRSKSNSKEDR